jgi:hypothetical protein
LQAWHQSKEPFKAFNKKTKRVASMDEAEESSQRAESRNGNPRFLREARGALAAEREIWGLDVAPQDPEMPASPFAKLSDQELERRTIRLDVQLERARAKRKLAAATSTG